MDPTDPFSIKTVLYELLRLRRPRPDSNSSTTTLTNCSLIKDIFDRFYRAPISIFTKLEKPHFLKEAQNALQEIQEKFLEPNEFEEITAAINDLMQIGGEKLLAGRLFDKK